jgi:hypothetical protein
MPAVTETFNKSFCEFAQNGWVDFILKDFDDVLGVFQDTDTQWDVVEFPATPNIALMIVYQGERYVSGFRIVKYADHFKSAKGCLYGVAGRYTGGGSDVTYKILLEREDFLAKLRKQLAH